MLFRSSAYLYTVLQWVMRPAVFVIGWITNGALRIVGLNVDRETQQTTLSREELRTVVAEAGVMIPKSHQELLDIDIALDTFPHGGVLTTCDALTMGVPVVTLTGERVLERYGATLVQEAGFAEGSVTDVDRYVGHAVSLGSDVPRLAALRPQLAASMRGSALCDAPRFTTTLEDAYDAMYRQTAGAPSA